MLLAITFCYPILTQNLVPLAGKGDRLDRPAIEIQTPAPVFTERFGDWRPVFNGFTPK